MKEKILDHLLKQVDEKVRGLEESLGTGVAKDYAEYLKMCGQITGLLTVRLNITDLKSKLENFDE
jgi:hypothetical protein